MNSPHKIVFEGFYGFQNTGDDAFVEVASWGSQKYWSCTNNAFIGSHLPTTKFPINSNQIVPNKKGLDRLNFMAQLKRADYMISAGGSTFGNIPFHSNKSLGKNVRRIMPKLTLGAIGVSVGPFKTVKAEKEVIRYLHSLDFLALRDQRSYDLVTSYNLPYKPVNAFDLAALLPKVYNEMAAPLQVSKPTAKVIGISICNYEQYTGGDRNQERQRNLFFKETIQLIEKDTSAHFKVFIINGNTAMGDAEVTASLLKNLNPERVTLIPYSPDVKHVWDEISSCDLMISTRLHGGIFACYGQVPFLMVEYHKKCGDFLSDVGQHPAYRLYDAAISPKEAVNIAQDILANGFKAPKHREETIALSVKNFTETIKL